MTCEGGLDPGENMIPGARDGSVGRFDQMTQIPLVTTVSASTNSWSSSSSTSSGSGVISPDCMGSDPD
jgi:hypothetical protein